MERFERVHHLPVALASENMNGERQQTRERIAYIGNMADQLCCCRTFWRGRQKTGREYGPPGILEWKRTIG